MIPTTPSALLGGARHGFFGRVGGVSSGLFESLNVGLGSSDDGAAVRENRARAVAAVAPGAQLVTCRQVHSAHALVAEPWGDDDRPEADALVTARPGLALGILTADCAPVLFHDPVAKVIGAAHAGWKGAFGGVLESTVAAMERLGARRDHIRAAIGPCIARRSYEVGPEFVERLVTADPANAGFFVEGQGGRQHFDLEAYCLYRLSEAGVRQVEALSIDTCANAGSYFSYRRATLAGEADYGRQLSLIAL